MQTIYLTGSEPLIQSIARAAFPGYSGRKFRLTVTDKPINCASYWEGGSRDYFAFVDLATMRATQPAPAQSAFDRTVPGLDAVSLPANVACVEHSIFCGKDMGLTIYVRPESATPLLPAAAAELPRDVRIVLAATRGLKSSHAGDSNVRFHESARETGITRDRWDAAKADAVARGLLNKAGAITTAGRNAIGDTRLGSALADPGWGGRFTQAAFDAAKG